MLFFLIACRHIDFLLRSELLRIYIYRCVFTFFHSSFSLTPLSNDQSVSGITLLIYLNYILFFVAMAPRSTLKICATCQGSYPRSDESQYCSNCRLSQQSRPTRQCIDCPASYTDLRYARCPTCRVQRQLTTQESRPTRQCKDCPALYTDIRNARCATCRRKPQPTTLQARPPQEPPPPQESRPTRQCLDCPALYPELRYARCAACRLQRRQPTTLQAQPSQEPQQQSQPFQESLPSRPSRPSRECEVCRDSYTDIRYSRCARCRNDGALPPAELAVLECDTCKQPLPPGYHHFACLECRSRPREMPEQPLLLASWAAAPQWRPLQLGRMNVECPHCGALHWNAEVTALRRPNGKRSFTNSCKNGGMSFNSPNAHIPDPPPLLRQLFSDNSREAKTFRANLRLLNSALSYTSVGCRSDPRLRPEEHQYIFQLQGSIYHMQGPLTTGTNQKPLFSQLYFLDPQQAISRPTAGE